MSSRAASAEVLAARAVYSRRVARDPVYRHTAQRWCDHLAVWPDADQRTVANCNEMIERYSRQETAS